MKVEVWAEIRRLFFNEGYSKSEIGRMLKVDRKTVKAAIEASEFKPDRPRRKGSKLDPFKSRISQILKESPGISAVRILEEIRKDGYDGGITILKDYLREVRGTRKEAFLRIETLPGEQAQVDWASCGKIRVGGYQRKLSCFVMVLSYSRMLYVDFLLSQSLEDFIEAHSRSFEFFRGVPRKILYDNLKSVVIGRFGKDIHFNQRFLGFSGHYLFEPILCNIAKAHEKGKVESGVKYVKRNFLAGRSFDDFWDLRREATSWRDNIANVRVHGTTRARPIDLFKEEKNQLLSLPSHPYDTSIIRSCRSTQDALVKFETNSYSVPFKYASQTLTLKATLEMVNIYRDAKLIASHKRSFEKYRIMENPSHYKGLIETKRSAKIYKARDEFLSLGKEAEAYLKGMVHQEINIDYHLQKIIYLIRTYGKTEVLGAMDDALKYGAFGWDYLHNIILTKRRKRGERELIGPIEIPGRPEVSNLEIQEQYLGLYDELQKEEEL